MPRWGETVQLPGGGWMHIDYSGPKREKPQPCCECGKPSDRLCDWPAGEGKTCDRPLCRRHARQPVPEFGKPNPDIDYCPEHYAMYQEQRRS